MSDEEQVGGTVTKQESTTVFKSSPKWYERFQWPQLILTMIVAAIVSRFEPPPAPEKIADLIWSPTAGEKSPPLA